MSLQRTNTRPTARSDHEAALELPGLTDGAKRLIEEARAELAAAESAEPTKKVVPLAVSAFLTSRKKVAAAELADWIDSEEDARRHSNPSDARCRAATTAARVPWCSPTTTMRRSRVCGPSLKASSTRRSSRPTARSTNGPVWVLAGFGAQHRKMGKSLYLRDETFAEWINKVDAHIQDERGYSIVELILDDFDRLHQRDLRIPHRSGPDGDLRHPDRAR